MLYLKRESSLKVEFKMTQHVEKSPNVLTLEHFFVFNTMRAQDYFSFCMFFSENVDNFYIEKDEKL